MVFRDYAKLILKALVRKTTPVRFNDFSRLTPISPTYGYERGTPIDRYYIHEFLLAHQLKIRNDVLEVGELRYAKEFSKLLTSSRILILQAGDTKSSDVTIRADLTDLKTVREAQFDCFICTQTLNFIFDVRAAVQGAHQLLKPGGVFLGTVAGVCQISRYDMDRWGDYWRFTRLSIERLLCERFGTDVTVTDFGNALVAQMYLQGVAVEDLPDRSILNTHDPHFPIVIGFCARKI